ncbi:MAG: bifunctional aldolase/short-chain dehydrogenase [Gemmatimonadales bacterium]
MQSRWNDADASRCASPLELRAYTSQLLGAEPSLVLHGGGNTSVKTREPNLFGDWEEVLFIKGSGWDLATIEPAGFAPVRLEVLRRLAELPALSDQEMIRAQRVATTDPAAPDPSVEALLHAVIPLAYVDHTHADAVVTITNTPGGAARIAELYGERVLVVPWVMPGFALARMVRDLTRSTDWGRLDGIVLIHHGVVTFADAARESYERMLELVTKAEQYLDRTVVPVPPRAERRAAEPPSRPADLLGLAQLRRAVGRVLGRPVIARLDPSPESRSFASRPDVAELAVRGPLTPDHVLRTKPFPLVAADSDWEREVAGYAERYRAYFARHAQPGHHCLNPAPRWVIWPGQGFVTLGLTAREAAMTEDIARHTAQAITLAERLGKWAPLGEREIFEVEYWEPELAKLGRGARPPLQGKVALVTGAASGIGHAVAKALHGQGAAVLALDVNPEVASQGLAAIVADVTDPLALDRAFQECLTRFGGLDILVSNAGMFPASRRIEDLDPGLWEQSLAVNLTSHLELLRRAVPFLRLGFDPCVVIVGSKNVPAPGPGAAAYSVAKAGLTQLARVAALELGRDGIRVNTIHPHLVLDTGAWSEQVLADRAAQYGMTVEEYQRNNLLGVEITSRDVASTVLALVGPAFAKTTGAQIPVDGGSDRVL